MSVYIKGMEMPTSCYGCPCNKDDGFGFFTCGVTKSECNFTSLPSDCPLVPIPPQGRLIDANEFLKRAIGTKCFHGDYALMLEELVGESTIIEAEVNSNG